MIHIQVPNGEIATSVNSITYAAKTQVFTPPLYKAVEFLFLKSSDKFSICFEKWYEMKPPEQKKIE
jgi:hypothetical protein